MEFYETVCNNHNQIFFEAESALKLVKNDKSISNKDEIINHLNNIKKYVKFAKKQGQHMENRLKKYRTAIEDLGFTRKNGREMI